LKQRRNCIKTSCIQKNVSFLKTSDPKKRDLIVDEFLKTKKNIQDSYLSERLGDIDIHRKMSKLFKPITDAQRDVKENLLCYYQQ